MSRFTTVLLSAVAAAAVATPASAAPKHNTKSPQETSAYWTPERMKNAKPRERARPGGGGGGGGTADWSSYAVPLSGTSYGGANLQNGKVFMTFGGSNYVCSGTAVTSSAGVNLVWTAGHCVTDGAAQSQFASNFMFVPGYYRGQEPAGRWTFTKLDSTPGWEAQGANRFTYDVGAAQVQRAGAPAATFAGTIGTRPISFGVNPTGQRLVAIGYPASGKFNGSQQHACASPFRRWDGTALLAPMQISCDMTGGSSGGGWFHDTNNNSVADAGETLVSNTSYGYQSLKNALFGPFLASGGQAQTLYNSMD